MLAALDLCLPWLSVGTGRGWASPPILSRDVPAHLAGWLAGWLTSGVPATASLPACLWPGGGSGRGVHPLALLVTKKAPLFAPRLFCLFCFCIALALAPACAQSARGGSSTFSARPA